MKSRKSRRKIIKIIDSSRIDDYVQIQSRFVDDFTTRFKFAQSDTLPVSVDLHRSISDKHNDLLLRPI